ncbi:Right handed beta helix region [Algoriphagus faecimaris]|uniref:Right handed beta helix region n=1 Tax=Algoriphagus faecimaris TaxID=686796 RepID=A0A1G6WKB7_9BACT|nr:right-handed parallel beta-helix repeat-containing protein [Algoriphagus faecimaris]SDD66133.1 Right handed beta helix region [Algoriphagus faecimaris]
MKILKNRFLLGILCLAMIGKLSAQEQENPNTTPNFANQGREWFVSATNGSGQLGTKERPAKDLGNIIHHLKPNDVIRIAAGTYLSRGASGSDEINVPVTIIGGYNESFTARDPWGDHKTIFTGTNDYQKSTDPRIYIRTDQQRESNGQLSQGGTIVVDGIIVDNGPRNRYHENKGLAIRRKADPRTNQNPSPGSGGIVIVASKFTNVAVQNCIVMNTAPSEGALSVRVFQGGKGIIRNNLTINNTGYGIHARTGYTGSNPELVPKFLIANNTSLFNWKHDPIATYGGDALALDQYLTAKIENNVFGFGHMGGILNKGAKIELNNNLFTGNAKYDYIEKGAAMRVDAILDEAILVDFNSDGNETQLIEIPMAERWANIYANRVELTRESVDAAVTVSNSGANQLRSMLGLNVQGSTVEMDAEIHLPHLKLEEALPVGQNAWNGKGCFNPR